MPWLPQLLGLCVVLLSSIAWAEPVDEVEVLVMQRQFAQAEAQLGALPVASEAPARLRALRAYLTLIRGQPENAVTDATALLESCAAGTEGCDDARDWARFVLLEAQDNTHPEVLEKLRAFPAELLSQDATRRGFLEARALLRQSRLLTQKDSLQLLTTTLQQAQQIADPIVRALLTTQVYLQLARVQLQGRSTEEVLTNAKAADEASEPLQALAEYRLFSSEAALLRAQALFSDEKFSEAREAAIQGLTDLEESPRPSPPSDILLALLQVRLSTSRLLNEPEETLRSAQRLSELTASSKPLTREQGDLRMQALETLFLHHQAAAKLEDALQVASTALDDEALKGSTAPAWWKASMLRWESSALQAMGKREALKPAEEAVKAARDDVAELIRCLEQEAQVLQMLGQHEEALTTARRGLEQLASVTNTRLQKELRARVLLTASRAARAQEKWDEAAAYASDAQSLMAQASSWPQHLLRLAATAELSLARVGQGQPPDQVLKLIDEELQRLSRLPAQFQGLLTLQLKYWRGYHLQQGRRPLAALKEFRGLLGELAANRDLRTRALGSDTSSDLSQWTAAALLELRNTREAQTEAEQCLQSVNLLADRQQQAEVTARCALQKGLALLAADGTLALDTFREARTQADALLDPRTRQDLKAQAELGRARALLSGSKLADAQDAFSTAIADLKDLAPAIRKSLQVRLSEEWLRVLLGRKKLQLAGPLAQSVGKDLRDSVPVPPELEALTFLQNPENASWPHLLEGLKKRRIQCQTSSGRPRDECIGHLLATVRLLLAVPSLKTLPPDKRLRALLEVERSLIQSPSSKPGLTACWRMLSAQLAANTLRGSKNQTLPTECQVQGLSGPPAELLAYVHEELFSEDLPGGHALPPQGDVDLVQQLQLRLTHRRVLVRFIEFDPDPLGSGAASAPRMGAFVVSSRGVDWQDLGLPTDKIKEHANGFFQKLSTLNDGNKPKFKLKDWEKDAKFLQDKLWSRVVQKDEERQILVVPDPSLLSVPFHALLDSSGQKFLAQLYDIHYLPVAAELLEQHEPVENTELFILGQPQAEAPEPPLRLSKSPQALFAWGPWDAFSGVDLDAFSPSPSASEPPPPPLDVPKDLATTAKSPLPLANLEATTLESHHRRRFRQSRAKMFLSFIATESALRTQVTRSAYVHVISHGFLLPSEQQASGGPVGSVPPSSPTAQEPDRWTGLPELSGGVLLAGFLDPRRSSPEDDGLLTALEARTLDLRGVHLLTLSACDSGQGPQNGLSALGFRSAFFAAGAHNLVLSLWKVNDRKTALLMDKFYDRLWSSSPEAPAETRSSPAAALTQAMRDYIDQEGGLQAHPYYWAPFIALGAD